MLKDFQIESSGDQNGENHVNHDYSSCQNVVQTGKKKM